MGVGGVIVIAGVGSRRGMGCGVCVCVVAEGTTHVAKHVMKALPGTYPLPPPRPCIDTIPHALSLRGGPVFHGLFFFLAAAACARITSISSFVS